MKIIYITLSRTSEATISKKGNSQMQCNDSSHKNMFHVAPIHFKVDSLISNIRTTPTNWTNTILRKSAMFRNLTLYWCLCAWCSHDNVRSNFLMSLLSADTGGIGNEKKIIEFVFWLEKHYDFGEDFHWLPSPLLNTYSLCGSCG